MQLSEKALLTCNTQLLQAAQDRSPQSIATLDQDATIVPSNQPCASWTYKDIKGFQPSIVVWHEQELVADSDFRSGNTPAASGLLEQVKTTIKRLPSGIEEIRYRGDGASYQEDLLTYLQDAQIEFSVSGMICQSIRDEAKHLPSQAWVPMRDRDGFLTEESWTELTDKPAWVGDARFILVRRRLSPQKEMQLEGLSPRQVIIAQQRYRLSLIVSNRSLPGEQLIHWHRERCGFGEAIHSALKHDCAGSWTPSKRMEANATWWTLAVIAHNLHSLMKLYVPNTSTKRLKFMRLKIINIPARFVMHARRHWLIVNQTDYEIIRLFFSALAQPPPLPT